MSVERERARMGSSNAELVAWALSLRTPASALTDELAGLQVRAPERVRPPRFRWLCRRGRHSWAVQSVTHCRSVYVPGGVINLATLTQQCRRCGLRWNRYRAPMPKRVST